MKVLIVDDEKHVRKSIRLLMNWNELGIDTILESENGRDAVEAVRERQPDIILTDMMMPIMNGRQLMQWLSEHAEKPHKIIVISGYNDFELLQHAIRFGGMDYLLKPIDPDQLNAALRKAVESLRHPQRISAPDETRKLELDLRELETLYRDKALSDLLHKPTAKSASSVMTRFTDKSQPYRCRVALLRFNALERSTAIASEDWLYSICKQIGTMPNRSFSFVNWHRPNEIIIVLESNRLDETQSYLRDIIKDCTLPASAGLHIGISDSTEFPHKLAVAYRQAAEAIDSRNVLDPSRFMHPYTHELPLRTRLRFEEAEEIFLLAVQSGSEARIGEATRSWVQRLSEQNGLTFGQLQAWLAEYLIVRRRWIDLLFKRDDPPAQLRLTESYLPLEDGEISLDRLKRDLDEDLQALQRHYFARRKKRQPHVIADIADYLRSRYQQDISLTDISERFFLNKEYISRRFKQEFDETITDYINRIRIEKAKVLLLNRELKVSEIAQMVGYQDEKYFSRVFKKLEATTPIHFRATVQDRTGQP